MIEASALAWRSKKWLVGAFTALVALSSVGLVSYWQGQKAGIKEGVDMYHQMCYHISGITVDEVGRVVVCGPGGVLSKKELDKELKARYNE